MTAIAIMIATHIGTAQRPAQRFVTMEQKSEFAMKNLLKGLKSGNAGVVESAMRITAQLKMRYPSADVTALVREIHGIAAAHPSGTMRYKAYITLNICADPGWYRQEPSTTTVDDPNFFRTAAVRMQQKLLGMNSP